MARVSQSRIRMKGTGYSIEGMTRVRERKS